MSRIDRKEKAAFLDPPKLDAKDRPMPGDLGAGKRLSGVARWMHRFGIRSRRNPDESFEMSSEVRLVRETGSVGDFDQRLTGH